MSNIPDVLGLTVLYDPSTNTSYVSFCYDENSDAEYFVLEAWNEDLRKWVPYDNKYGIIERGNK